MDEAALKNKAAVMDALAAAGITSVEVEFDGNSDQGQIESIAARASEATVQLPATPIVMLDADENDTTPSEHEMPLEEAIESLCYHYLGGEYAGWETNEGAYGTFRFAVAERSISLDFTQRFIGEEEYNQKF